MLVYVTQAKYIEGYQIDVLFNDKSRGIVDLESVIKKDHRPIVKELIDLKKFKKFRVDMDTIVWSNGLDLAPEFLHSKLQKPQRVQKKKKTQIHKKSKQVKKRIHG